MEELELKDILNIFQQKIIFIAAIIILVTTLGTTYMLFFKKPLYYADTTMVLTASTNSNANTASNVSITQSDVLLNQKLVSTYSEIIKSRKIAEQVIQNLKLDYTIEKLNSMISVSSKKDTEMLQIRVLNEDPNISANIANSVAEIFSKEIINIYNIKNVSIIDKAIVNLKPYNIDLIKQIVIFFFIGVALAFGLVFVIYCLDTTVKDPEEVEIKLGMSVLSCIPKYKK